MKIKHPFAVNQVWVSESYPEKSFYIYQINCPDKECAYDCNWESYVESVIIDKALFDKRVEDYQRLHNVKDTTTTYPYCVYMENHINSLKQYIKRYECKLLCTENYSTNEYDHGNLIVVADEERATQAIWDKYSSKQ